MSFAVRPIGLVKSAFVFRQTISSDATNYVLRNAAITAGWDGIVPLDAEVTVASGIVLSANSTSLYGFDTGSGFPAGTTLKLIMPGYVCGMGGAGGASYTAGSNGGPALRAQYAISIDAAGGVIGGGGGGGGSKGGGGGGRSGRTDAAGGTGVPAGESGTFSSGGSGGHGGGAGGTTGPGGDHVRGGGGGGWGASGGTAGSDAGGTGGAAVVGNSYITWINTGTRYGAIT